MKSKNEGRHTLLAVFLGLMLPGLGQIYNGELVKGISFFLITLASVIIGVWTSVRLPAGMLLAGTVATFLTGLAIYGFAVFDAHRSASLADTNYQLKSYNRWYFYLAVLLIGHVISGSVHGYVRGNYIEAFRIPTRSMEPTVRQGDYLLADKTAYKRMAPRVGDVVIFVNPNNRSQRYIKRIEALPGNTITGADGKQKTVPHGHVYVLGDNRQNSLDSRNFGFLPLSDIVGKARQIYYSSGPEGIRWSRIGNQVSD